MLKEKIINEINKLKSTNNFRVLKEIDTTLINLSSNDYLGIGSDLSLKKEFYNSFSELPLSSSSSRLISGTTSEVTLLEKTLNDIYHKPGLFFNSGFDCNCCVIETFCDKDTLVISDKLNHASIHDGIVHSGAKLLRYRHLDLDHLESIILKNINLYPNILVISETIYSMDGDCVDLDKLISLKRKYNFLLMIDEAHSFGVHGYGLSYEKNYIKDIDFLTIPLGKGGGAMGSYLICEEIYKEYIINRGRKFIYTTALPPINIAWNLFILKKIPELKNKINELNTITQKTHSLVKRYNFETFSTTHIISIIIGDNEKLNNIVEYLKNKNFFVYGVKEPTVPKGTSRIRIGLNPNLKIEILESFFKELDYAVNNIF